MVLFQDVQCEWSVGAHVWCMFRAGIGDMSWLVRSTGINLSDVK